MNCGLSVRTINNKTGICSSAKHPANVPPLSCHRSYNLTSHHQQQKTTAAITSSKKNSSNHQAQQQRSLAAKTTVVAITSSKHNSSNHQQQKQKQRQQPHPVSGGGGGGGCLRQKAEISRQVFFSYHEEHSMWPHGARTVSTSFVKQIEQMKALSIRLILPSSCSTSAFALSNSA